jgi:hypothetical protein
LIASYRLENKWSAIHFVEHLLGFKFIAKPQALAPRLLPIALSMANARPLQMIGTSFLNALNESVTIEK